MSINKPETNTPLIKEADRVRVCKNLTCNDYTEYSMVVELCPTCGKKMASTTKGARLFEPTQPIKSV